MPQIFDVRLFVCVVNFRTCFIFVCSIFVFLDRDFSSNITFSFLGKTSFYNFLTREYDPINAPEYKINGTLTYMPDLGINWNIGMRYIPEFNSFYRVV